MTTANLVNSAGLFLDIVAAVLVWRYGLPQPISRTGAIHLVLEQTDQTEVAKGRRYDAIAQFGMGLLMAGFGLQLVSNFL